MRVLILGGTRFIGPPVVRQLLESGHEVAVFHRGQTETSLPQNVKAFHGNRERLGDYLADFRAYEPEVVFRYPRYDRAGRRGGDGDLQL